MSMDLAEFYGAFFDEADELLSNMESLLLGLDLDNPDFEVLNAIFRAAHSIKGGAATFGVFESLVQTTHKLENVLDEIRNRRLALTKAAVDTFLRGRDILADQLSAYRAGDKPDEESAQEFIAALGLLLEDGSEAGHEETVQPVEVSAPAAELTRPSAKATLEVSFIGVSDSDRATLQSELSMMGDITGERTEGNKHTVDLVTDVDAQTIQAICSFVINDDQIVINQVESLAPSETESYPVPNEPKSATNQAAAPTLTPTPAPAAAAAKASVAEDASDKASQKKDTSTLRVATSRVDQLVNQVGEIVIDQAILIQACQKLDPIEHSMLLASIEHMSTALRGLQESVMSLRMVPMDYAFGRFPRVVRETSAKLQKNIELKTIGGATEMDKGVIEKLIDPLTHIVRNSMDHGIEKPDVRRAIGKNPVGQITMSAFHEGGRIIVEVTDDGAGMNREKILAKAAERGMPVTPNMPDSDVFALVFAPGFSTADVVTDVSGRGVGMDVVLRNIQSIGGQIQIKSAQEIGTTLRISLPLTLAIMDGMSIQVGQERYVLALNHIIECLQPQADHLHVVGRGTPVLRLRGEHLPILSLANLFDIEGAATDLKEAILVVVQVGQERYALAVDQLLGQHQVVVKSLETHYERVMGTSGATILGDGSVALILDAATLLELSRQLA